MTRPVPQGIIKEDGTFNLYHPIFEEIQQRRVKAALYKGEAASTFVFDSARAEDLASWFLECAQLLDLLKSHYVPYASHHGKDTYCYADE